MSGKEIAIKDYSFHGNIKGLLEVYREIKKIGIAVGVGFGAAVVISFPAALLAAEVVQTHTQLFAVGAGLAIIGMGGILSQLLLKMEEAHHSIYPTPEWIATTRLKLILLSVSFAGFLTAGFFPIEQPEAVWKNPVSGIFNSTTLVLAGVLSPYAIKLITDFTSMGSGTLDKRIKQLMVVFPLVFLSIIILAYRIALPNEPTQLVVEHGITSIAGSLGLLYSYLREKPNDGWRVETNHEVNDYFIVTELRKVGWRTFFLATLGWIGYILAAGTRSGAEVSFDSEIHLFPLLIAFRGVLGVLGAILAVVTIFLLVRALLSSVRLCTKT